MPERSQRVFHAGRLVSRGDYCDYFETDADGVPCILKVVSHRDDSDLLDIEAEILRELWVSPVKGAEHFTKYLPRLVAGTQLSDGRAVNVLASGHGVFSDFVSLEEIYQAFPNGLSPRHMVWMANRMFEILSWLQRNGVVHGGVLPMHIMYWPDIYSHGGMLWNWCQATRIAKRQKLPVKVAGYEAWYPSGMLGERPPMPADDTIMLVRCMIKVLGGDPLTGELPDRAYNDEPDKDPKPLFELLQSVLTKTGIPRFPNTDDFRREFNRMTKQVYGPKKFIPFTMPAGFRGR